MTNLRFGRFQTINSYSLNKLVSMGYHPERGVMLGIEYTHAHNKLNSGVNRLPNMAITLMARYPIHQSHTSHLLLQDRRLGKLRM
jgi:hypothetical protein